MGNSLIWLDQEDNWDSTTTFGPDALIYWVQTVISGISKLILKL